MTRCSKHKPARIPQWGPTVGPHCYRISMHSPGLAVPVRAATRKSLRNPSSTQVADPKCGSCDRSAPSYCGMCCPRGFAEARCGLSSFCLSAARISSALRSLQERASCHHFSRSLHQLSGRGLRHTTRSIRRTGRRTHRSAPPLLHSTVLSFARTRLYTPSRDTVLLCSYHLSSTVIFARRGRAPMCMSCSEPLHALRNLGSLAAPWQHQARAVTCAHRAVVGLPLADRRPRQPRRRLRMQELPRHVGRKRFAGRAAIIVLGGGRVRCRGESWARAVWSVTSAAPETCLTDKVCATACPRSQLDPAAHAASRRPLLLHRHPWPARGRRLAIR